LDPLADASPTPTPIPTPTRPKDPNIDYYEDPLPPEPKQIFVTNVPAEFRRIELFITGTIPNRSLITPDENTDETTERPTPSPTPLNETWQDSNEPPKSQLPGGTRTPRSESSGKVTVTICPLTGMRATSNCPTTETRTYKAGTEPKEFCTFHR